MRKTISLLCFLLLFSGFSFGQLWSGKNLKLTGTISDSLKYIDVMNIRAIQMYHKNADSTFLLASRARNVADRLQYNKGKADALNNIGLFFAVKGNLNLALRYYSQANTLYKQLKDSVNCVQLMMNMALVYSGGGKYNRAVKKFDGAMQMGQKLRQDSIMSLVIAHYLLCCPNKFKAPQKRKYIAQAEKIANRYHDKISQLVIDQVKADELIAEGKEKLGISLLRRAIDTASNRKLYYLSMDLLIDIGDHLANSDSALAANYYKKGLTIAGQKSILIYKELIARRLFGFYIKRNDNSSATSYSNILVAVHDEKEGINNSNSIDYLDYALKEEQVSTLLVRSKYQFILLILVGVISIQVIAILIVIRKNLRQTKRLNEQVLKQNDQMKNAVTALEQSHADNANMLKIVAHDLRSPVAGIYSIAMIMMEQTGRSQNDQELLRLIKNSSNDSLELVNNLLQIQFKKQEIKKTLVDLAEILRHCVSLLQSNAEWKLQQISLKTQSTIILANREKLWRVISNLITNAIKFSPKHSKIEVWTEESATYIRIIVSDEGIGIPSAIENKIFNMFTTVRREGTEGEESFGLGLAISKQIVESHEGKIWFERRPGRGSIFFVELPYHPKIS